ncbi:putative nucleic acid-binding protein [Helianthus annuus]|nr:putative nucleic acid-binding protein [Helianthus annuus]KAJ0805208.1 putative nucleic acid-binding protein [Helianthus annuus]
MMFLSLPMLPFLPEMPLTGRLIITPPLHVQRTIPSDWPVSVQELDRSTPAEYLDLGSCTKASCPKCGKSILQVDTEWFYTKDGTQEKANTMYQIITIATDNAGRIQAVIFDRAGKQLLGMICEELAANEDPIKTL